MCLAPHLPDPGCQQSTRLLRLCCQNRQNVWTIVELPRPKFSATHRATLLLAHLHSDVCDGLDKYSCRSSPFKESLSVNSNQSSIVAKLSRSAVYFQIYLTSSPPPTQRTFSILQSKGSFVPSIVVFTEGQPQVFSAFSCCPVSHPKDSLGNEKARRPASRSYILAFSNISLCHRSGLCALRVSH